MKKAMKHTQGGTLIELLVAIAITAVILPAILTGFISLREHRPQQDKRFLANQRLMKAEEAVRSLRNQGWSNIATNGTFHHRISGGNFQLISGAGSEDGITEEITIEDVMRDSDNAIVESGGTVDPSTKKVMFQISWSQPIPSSFESVSYFSRYRENATYVQTTDADFNAGAHTGTVVTNDNGGEVILGSGGSGDWCTPSFEADTVDLPKNGVANAITAIEGRAFTVTGNNASGVAFADVTISNTSPPDAELHGTFDGYKTNDVFGEGNYAYLATDDNQEEIVIIEISAVPHSKTGSFNGQGSTNASTVFVQGSVGYMTQGSTLRTFDLSSKNGNRPQLDSVNLAGNASEIAVAGNYAYVTFSSGSALVQIINVQNPSDIFSEQVFNGSYGNAVDIIINESKTRAYVALEQSSYPEFVIIELLNAGKNYGNILGTYNTTGMSPNALAIVPGNRAILVGTGGQEYQVLDISNENNPTLCGGLESDNGIRGVAAVLESDGDAYTYIITGDSSAEFKIISGGPGGSYADSGEFESSFFDPGYSTAFNRLIPQHTTPANTQVQYQIAITDPISNSCNHNNYVFTGPDGTDSTFFSGEGAIDFDNDSLGYENPARCMKYKVYLSSTDSSSTPIFEQMQINYSP